VLLVTLRGLRVRSGSEGCRSRSVAHGAARNVVLAEVLHVEGNVGGSVGEIVNAHVPRAAADLAVLDILLIAAASRIQRDLVDFSTIGAANGSPSFGGAVSEGELLIQIIV